MAWVRYDDQFHAHPKVTAVIAEDPGAIALHVLANTWTNAQKRPGYVPKHQPTVLLCDRELAHKWAALLVKVGLWHDDGGATCPACSEEYADLGDVDGYVIHNAKEYRAPARERTTPGTSTELSAKRRAAGRKGGRASAAKRQANEANEASAQANQANDGLLEVASTASGEIAGPAADVAGAAPEGASASPAETSPAARANQANGQANGVSKSDHLLLAGVTPEPEPEPKKTPTESLGAAPRATTKRRATRLPDDWEPDGELKSWFASKVVNGQRLASFVDIDIETEKFRNHWWAKPGKDGTKQDWNAAWRNWMLNAVKFAPTRSAPSQRGVYRDPANQDAYDDWTRGPR